MSFTPGFPWDWNDGLLQDVSKVYMSFLYLGPAPLKCIALFVPPCLEFQWSCVKVWEKLLSRIIFIIEKTWYILLYAVEYVKETYGSVIKSIHETSTEVPTIFCLFACLKIAQI